MTSTAETTTAPGSDQSLGRLRNRVVAVLAVAGVLAVAAVTLDLAGPRSPDASGSAHDGAGEVESPTDGAGPGAPRCDAAFNHRSYWAEAEALGVDTEAGGSVTATTADAASSDGHAHGVRAAAPVRPPSTTATTRPDPLRGRGSVALDQLLARTKRAEVVELETSELIGDLADATDADYESWLSWMSTAGLIGHPHDPATPEDGHRGHAGPQGWTAISDPRDCSALEEELGQAREAALALPTGQDAVDAGYTRMTSYLPGIATHYLNFALVDDKLQVGRPELLLYDGDGPDARVVGVSYYVLSAPETEPTQGFTGQNDHFHRHFGLCVKDAFIIGDSQTTKAECEAKGGITFDGLAGWMKHAWVVPGCESPWGLFSLLNPVLDRQLGERSGTDGGHCAASSVRDRYDLGPPPG